MFVKSNSSLSSSQPNMKLIPTLEQDCAAWIDADGKYQTTWAGASEFPAQNGRGLRVQCLSACSRDGKLIPTRGRSSLVSLTSNVTFGHRSVATYRGPICQCQQNTCTNTHFHLLLAVTTVSHLSNGLHKKADLSSSALPSSFLSPGQSSTTLPGHLPTGLFPSPARTRSLQSACPFAYPSLLSHLWDSLPTESGSCGLSRLWPRGRSYISNRCKEEVCDIHICLSQCHNATRLNIQQLFICVGFHPTSFKWRYIYLQKINLV